MKNLLLTSFFWICANCLFAQTIPGFGAGNALDFSDTRTAKNHIDVGLLPQINSADFTIEFWLYVNANIGDPAIFANKNWASGTNMGLAIAMNENLNSAKFNYTTTVGGRRDANIASNLIGSWNHIAITFKRDGNAVSYQNGVQTSVTDISVSNGSLAGAFSYKLGQDGTGDYTYNGEKFQLDGQVDEFRIWTTLRSPDSIRANMCKRLKGNEPDLYVYFPIIEKPGSDSIINYSTINNANNGQIINNRPGLLSTSGAPVGDQSVVLSRPASDWGTTNGSLSSSHGQILVDSIAGTAPYVHVYQNDSLATVLQGLPFPDTSGGYFGTFAPGPLTARVRYAFGMYPKAMVFQQNITPFFRQSGISNWSFNSTATKQGETFVLRQFNSKNAQIALGNFINSCNSTPQNLAVSQITSNSAVLAFSSTASLHSVSVGTVGFTPGNGQIEITGDTTSLISLTQLLPNTQYQVYARDSCLFLGNGAWSGPVGFTTLDSPNFNAGSGTMMNFNSNPSGGNYVDAGQLPAINEGDFTVEMWIYVDANSSDPAFFSNKDWASGNNRGLALAMNTNASTYKMNLRSSVGSRVDLNNCGSNLIGRWNHIALTFKRDGFCTAYQNGNKVDSINISAINGNLLSPFSYKIGQDGTGNYTTSGTNPRFRGQIDEFRIWSKVLNQQELRSGMCRKMKGNEPGLYYYLPVVETGGDTLFNRGNPVLANSIIKNANNNFLAPSQAPIGDTSVFVYTENLQNIRLSLPTNQGTFLVKNLLGTDDHFHLFQVKGNANFRQGLNALPGQNSYFGVFSGPSNTTRYQAQFNYANYQAAIPLQANIEIATRVDNSSNIWSIAPARNVASGDSIFTDMRIGRFEFTLNNGAARSCPAVDTVNVQYIGNDSVSITWNNGLSTTFNALQTTNRAPIIPQSSLLVNTSQYKAGSLIANQFYNLYIEKPCGSSSIWSGPFYFSGELCETPINLRANVIGNTAVIKWDRLSPSVNDFSIEWGPEGFQSGFGITATATGDSLVISGLFANTVFEARVLQNCRQGLSSPYSGRVRFSTVSSGLQAANLSSNLMVYPNPANKGFNLKSEHGMRMVLMYNIQGKLVKKLVNISDQEFIECDHLPPGHYWLLGLFSNDQKFGHLIQIKH